MEYFVDEVCFRGSETSSGFRKFSSTFQVHGIKYYYYYSLFAQYATALQYAS